MLLLELGLSILFAGLAVKSYTGESPLVQLECVVFSAFCAWIVRVILYMSVPMFSGFYSSIIVVFGTSFCFCVLYVENRDFFERYIPWMD